MAGMGRFLDAMDSAFGDGLEKLLRDHHRRRLRGLGWEHALNAAAWTPGSVVARPGNSVEVLIDGVAALGAMHDAIRGAERSVHIAGWHASPDFRLTRADADPPLRDLLAEVAERVPVRLLLWAGPPVPAFEPTRRMVQDAHDEFVRETRVRCALDKRERTMHCHHEKIVVVDGTLAFVGGIDFTALQGDRYDDPEHPMREPLGWHDLAVRLQGPAVADVARHFAQRWGEVTGDWLPWPAEPAPEGSVEVQVLRTVPERTYAFARRGEFSILEAYLGALRSAERFVYLENQFLWSPEIVDVLTAKLERPPDPDFRVVLVLPTKPSSGADTTRGQLGRLLDADQSGRILATTINENPVYIHAKVGIVDDRWLTIGSANLNEHSLFNDTELNVLTCDPALARETRLRLWAEHLELPVDDVDGEPCAVVDGLWRPIATEQSRRAAERLPRTHRLSLLPNVSRRSARLAGPVRGLLVDG
jgi:phosphatidylserine/phosphatidylglycerophosphate/cardiolipin synthase-like enzyme